MSETAVVCEQACLQWGLRLPDLRVASGERLFVRGRSGSGKSSLLRLIAGLERPVRGTVTTLGLAVGRAKSAELQRLRAERIGFVFQTFNLVPYLSAWDNVLVPGVLSAKRRERARAQGQGSEAKAAEMLLEALGVPPSRWHAKPAQLSVGEQQRVALARAFFGQPELILADEPTSALDTVSAEAFLTLLEALWQQTRPTIVFVSHDPRWEACFDRTLVLGEGQA